MAVISEHIVEFSGRFYKISRVTYGGASTTFLVDQNADGVASIDPSSGAPAATIGAADSNFEKTVTLAAGGSSTAGVVTVITTHSGTPSGVKPSSRA